MILGTSHDQRLDPAREIFDSKWLGHYVHAVVEMAMVEDRILGITGDEKDF